MVRDTGVDIPQLQSAGPGADEGPMAWVLEHRRSRPTLESSDPPSRNSPLPGLAASALQQQPHALVVAPNCCEMEGSPASATKATQHVEQNP